GSRRQAGQVERDATNQSGSVRFRRRGKTFALETSQDEVVNRIAWPAGILDHGHRRALWRDQGPVFLPPGALLDPAPDQLDLLGSELASGAGGGHALGGIIGGDAQVNLGLVRLAGDEGTVAVTVAEGALLCVQPEVCLALRLVGTVTPKANIRQDRADIAVELDRRGGRGGGPGGRGQEEQGAERRGGRRGAPLQPSAGEMHHRPVPCQTEAEG